MLKEVTLSVPRSLQAVGPGIQVTFAIEILDVDLTGWECSCKLGDLPAATHTFSFSREGVANPCIPGDYVGETVVLLELVDRQKDIWLSGWFKIYINRPQEPAQAGPASIVAGGNAVVYCVTESNGSQAGTVKVVGESNHVRLRLKQRRPSQQGAVPLSHLLRREDVIVLPSKGERTARVLQIHAGRRLVLGRCYSSQLGDEARARMNLLDAGQVDWVTNWDDPAVHRLSLCLQHHPGADGGHLEVRNITDYPPFDTPIRLSGIEDRLVEPGGSVTVPVANQGVLVATVGRGIDRRELVRFRFEEITAGDVRVPVYRTDDYSFRWPPGAESGSRDVHFLGIWIPKQAAELRDLLSTIPADKPLHVAFFQDDLWLWFSYEAGLRHVRVWSNENLEQAVNRG